MKQLLLLTTISFMLLTACDKEEIFFCGQTPDYIMYYSDQHYNSRPIDYQIRVLFTHSYDSMSSYVTYQKDTIILDAYTVAPKDTLCYNLYFDLNQFNSGDSLRVHIDLHSNTFRKKYLNKKINIL